MGNTHWYEVTMWFPELQCIFIFSIFDSLMVIEAIQKYSKTRLRSLQLRKFPA
jgi:hypothetical protein